MREAGTARRTEEPEHLFICGPGHSGTTLMLAILDSHAQIGSIPRETGIFHRVKDDAELLRMVEDWPRKFGLDRSAAYIAEKTPVHCRYLDRLFRLFPTARVIFMIRDGRDAALSAAARLGDFKLAAMRWAKHVDLGLAWADDPRFHIVRYEDLISDTEAALHRVCSFLDLPFDRSMLSHASVERRWWDSEVRPADLSAPLEGANHKRNRNWQINQPIFDGSGRWKREMTDTQQRVFWSVAARSMEAAGYAAVGASVKEAESASTPRGTARSHHSNAVTVLSVEPKLPAGLNNQRIILVGLVALALARKAQVSVPAETVDFAPGSKRSFVPTGSVFDLDAMNDVLRRFGLYTPDPPTEVLPFKAGWRAAVRAMGEVSTETLQSPLTQFLLALSAAPTLRSMAAGIIARLPALASVVGVQLRIENDWVRHIRRKKANGETGLPPTSAEDILDRLAANPELNGATLYLCCDEDDLPTSHETIKKAARDRGFDAHFKSDLADLPTSRLQRSMIDFTVCLGLERYAGLPQSSFSRQVVKMRELRADPIRYYNFAAP